MRKGADARILYAELLMYCRSIRHKSLNFTSICSRKWKILWNHCLFGGISTLKPRIYEYFAYISDTQNSVRGRIWTNLLSALFSKIQRWSRYSLWETDSLIQMFTQYWHTIYVSSLCWYYQTDKLLKWTYTTHLCLHFESFCERL